jgi:hypothetical protein
VEPEHTYRSALGWFDLGNYVEAWNELENLPPSVAVFSKAWAPLRRPLNLTFYLPMFTRLDR